MRTVGAGRYLGLLLAGVAALGGAGCGLRDATSARPSSSGSSGSSSGSSSGPTPGSSSGAGSGSSSGAGSTSSSGGAASSGSSSGGSSGAPSSSSGASSSSGGSSSGAVGPVPDLAWVEGTCAKPSGALSFETAELCVSLSPGSQTVAALRPKAARDFDFTPADLLASRSGAGYFHLGDVTLRLRTGGSGAWRNVTTAASRTPVRPLTVAAPVLAAADLSPALPSDLPVTVSRSWVDQGGRLVLRVEVKNRSSAPVEIGALGLPMIFNNVITNRTLEQAHATCSFSDPYIGRDAGYLQVTRLSGQGPALLVLPDGRTPFEAYSPILDGNGKKDPVVIFKDPTRRGQTFEGFLEWMVHSKAYADGEWSSATPWNPATALTLAPGESRTYGVQLVLADQIRDIERTLVREQRPVAVGIPGYILPTDLNARLFLKYPAAVRSLAVEPAGAIAVTADPPTATGWKAYTLAGKSWGRARLTVTYDDGVVQTVHYVVIKPAGQVVSDLGAFLTSKAWYVNDADPFGRSPSVMTYDREADRVVTQHRQAWVCGLGDDGGATWLAGAMKLFGQPVKAEVAKYQQLVDGVIWGGLQYKDGSLQYGVKRTLFYYEPASMPAGTYSADVAWTDDTGATYWGAWSKAHVLEVPRSYNYPHVAALYWAMYRLARNHTGLVSNHGWDWYLDHAYRTAVAMTTLGNEYAAYGLMDGTIFIEILKDLKREGLTASATDLESRMKARADRWRGEAYPFGSEMAWDSTGQEEVYGWTRHFGDAAKARVCIDAILGYMPAIPHWGYHGCARRYWDFVYGGAKIDRYERMLHHYGSSLNAIPVLTEFRDRPDDVHLLRVGYAGMMGSLTNVDQQGAPSMAFHSFPDTLRWDPVSGDYGLSFFGHAHDSATYVIDHADFGWQAFGGNLTVSGSAVSVVPLDSLRRRVYLAPLGLWLTLDAGQLTRVELDTATHAVRLTLAPSDAATPSARLRVEQPARRTGVGTFAPTGSYPKEREAYVVPLGSSTTEVRLAER